MENRIYLNDDWKFTPKFDEKITGEKEPEKLLEVRLPHTVKELPLHYFDENDYQMLSGYRKVFTPDKSWKKKTVLLTFEGVAHDATVYLNGKEVGSHHCGYTAFSLDISDELIFDKENVLAVKVDSKEDLNIPPFGFVIDYMTYGGIYRDVYLKIKENTYIEDAFVSTKITKEGKNSAVITNVKVVNPKAKMKLIQSIKKSDEKDFVVLENEIDLDAKTDEYTLTQKTGEIKLWDIDDPNLYVIKTQIVSASDKVVDEKSVRFGYRKAVFHKDGFYLNGKKVKIRGLNRHQSYAYTGYAMPESMQKLDADILKKELGLNAVRTSHYPQSHYFLDRCDELGLLVFTEIPGWQHIGDDAWKDQAVENVKDMVIQYRNHTSIILWGVRINESLDDDEFYLRTNEMAHLLDPTRQTGGVRCYKKGSLLEDVYTYNDFSHSGKNKGCEKKMAVTPNMDKPYFVSEYNGHMYPCKSFDWEERRAEHALRHARVLNDVAKEKNIAGSFGWCMFDYNTHKDFGSGDRICYHGVMDMFRNPKLAAFIYAAQQEETPVLELSSTMDIGEHPGCNRGDIYIITNADSVKMYKNDHFIKEYTAKDSKFNALKHGPIRIDDYIGDTLEIGENMSHSEAEAIKELLNETARGGLYNLPKQMYVKAVAIMAKYHLTTTQAAALYNKYIGDWGGTSTTYTFEAYKDGEVVNALCVKPMTKIHIDADIDHDILEEKNSYDVAAIRLNAVDECGNVLHFYNDVVKVKVTGPVQLIGPDTFSLHGGMGGTYIKTTGKKGKGTVAFETATKEKTVVSFEVK